MSSKDCCPASEVPRRAQLDQLVPAERAINDACLIIETTMGCDVRLTEAQNLLLKAKDLVGDVVDERKKKFEDKKEELDTFLRTHLKLLADKAGRKNAWTCHEFTASEINLVADHLRDLGFKKLGDEMYFWAPGYTATKYLQLMEDWLRINIRGE